MTGPTDLSDLKGWAENYISDLARRLGKKPCPVEVSEKQPPRIIAAGYDEKRRVIVVYPLMRKVKEMDENVGFFILAHEYSHHLYGRNERIAFRNAEYWTGVPKIKHDELMAELYAGVVM